MAEGGFEFDNPVYDEDDYDEEEDLPMIPADDGFNRTTQIKIDHIWDVGYVDVDTRTKLSANLRQSMVEEYYDLIKKSME